MLRYRSGLGRCFMSFWGHRCARVLKFLALASWRWCCTTAWCLGTWFMALWGHSGQCQIWRPQSGWPSVIWTGVPICFPTVCGTCNSKRVLFSIEEIDASKLQTDFEKTKNENKQLWSQRWWNLGKNAIPMVQKQVPILWPNSHTTPGRPCSLRSAPAKSPCLEKRQRPGCLSIRRWDKKNWGDVQKMI